MRNAAALFAVMVAGTSSAVAQEPEALTLRSAIEGALANSSEVEAAEQNVRIASSLVREAWATVLPDVMFNASYQRNLRVQEAFLPAIIFDPTAGPDDLIPVRFGSDNIWQATVSFSQPIFEARAFVGVGAASWKKSGRAVRARRSCPACGRRTSPRCWPRKNSACWNRASGGSARPWETRGR
jgi:hypothetical protein